MKTSTPSTSAKAIRVRGSEGSRFQPCARKSKSESSSGRGVPSRHPPGLAPRLRVQRQHVVEPAHVRRAEQIQRFLHHRGYVEEAEAPFEEERHGHLVR